MEGVLPPPLGKFWEHFLGEKFEAPKMQFGAKGIHYANFKEISLKIFNILTEQKGIVVL